MPKSVRSRSREYRGQGLAEGLVARSTFEGKAMTILPYPFVSASGSSILRMSGDEKTMIFRVDSRVYPFGQVIPYYPVTAFCRAGAGVPGADGLQPIML